MFLKSENKLYQIFSKMRWCVFVVVASTLIFFVILMGALRLVLPYLPSYEAEIENELQTLLDYPVSISRIDAGWQWFSPQLKLVDVSVLQKNKKTQLVRFDEVIFGFDVIESLVDFKFEPSVVTLKGATFHIHRKSAEEYSVQGIDLPKLSSTNNAGIELGDVFSQMDGKELRFQKTTVRWVDEVRAEKHQTYKNINLSLQLDYPSFSVNAEADVPESIGKKVRVVGKLNTEQEQWQSDLYINAKDIQLQSLMGYMDDAGLSISSSVDTELWLNFNDFKIETITGRVLAENLVVHANRNVAAKQWVSERLSGVFYVQHKGGSWQAAVDDLNLQVGDSKWEDVYFSVNYKETSNSLDAYFDYIELSDLSGLIESLPINADFISVLNNVDPRGELRAVEVHADEWKRTKNWKLNAQFNGLGLSAPNKEIRVDGLSGTLNMDRNNALVNLSSEQLKIVTPFFNQPVNVTELDTEINIHKNNDDYSISANAIKAKLDSVLLESRLEYVSGKDAFLDLQVAFGDTDAKWFNTHRADGLFGKAVADWLSGALVEGQFKKSGFLFRGVLAEFPFRANEGIIQSHVDVEKGILKYQPDWPDVSDITARFTLENEVIKVDRASGRMDKSIIENSVTTINLAGDSHVMVSGDIKTSSKEVSQFFRSTPLKQDYLDAIQYAEFGGDINLRLNIDVPLVKDGDVTVSGEVDLSNNNFIVKDYNYEISNANGVIKFKDTFISADQLVGEFNGGKVIAAVKTKMSRGSVKTELLANFNTDVGSLISLDENFSTSFNGKADWQLLVNFNHSSNKLTELMSFDLSSDLNGIEMVLPEPFRKAKNKPSGLRVKFNVFNESSSALVNYDTDLNLNMSWDDGFSNIKSDIQINTGPVKDLNEGLNVTAKIKRLDVQEWHALLSPYFKNNKKGVSFPVMLNLNAEMLTGDQFQLHDLFVNAKSINNDWAVDVTSKELDGAVKVPGSYSSGSALVMDFKKLDLSAILGEGNKEDSQTEKILSIQPGAIPPLHINANDFSYKGYHFNEMSLITNRTSYGLTVHALDLKDDNLSVNVRGNWFSKKKAKDSSNFRLEIESDDVGKMFKRYGFTESIEGGSGKTIVNWQWNASPFDFEWQLVSGKMEADIDDGKFIDIEPGAGRLLGMFSLSALPRRFFLDFSDTFSEGFEFDKFKAHANFNNGNLYTNNARLTGSSADVYFKGRIGLADESYNQIMSVVPRISSGVSGWIALAQGAVVGLTAYVGQKLLGVDEAAKNQYHITGSWSEPVIKKIGDAAEEGDKINTSDEEIDTSDEE